MGKRLEISLMLSNFSRCAVPKANETKQTIKVPSPFFSISCTETTLIYFVRSSSPIRQMEGFVLFNLEDPPIGIAQVESQGKTSFTDRRVRRLVPFRRQDNRVFHPLFPDLRAPLSRRSILLRELNYARTEKSLV